MSVCNSATIFTLTITRSVPWYCVLVILSPFSCRLTFCYLSHSNTQMNKKCSRVAVARMRGPYVYSEYVVWCRVRHTPVLDSSPYITRSFIPPTPAYYGSFASHSQLIRCLKRETYLCVCLPRVPTLQGRQPRLNSDQSQVTVVLDSPPSVAKKCLSHRLMRLHPTERR